MCMTRKVASVSVPEPEVIQKAKEADASLQKANAENRAAKNALASDNIRTSNYGVEDDVMSSKKKLLGE